MIDKEKIFDYLIALIGTPYMLGGDYTNQGGLDCSGFILEGLRSIGRWGNSDASSQEIYDKFKSNKLIQQKAQRGDLLFFGKSDSFITHVSIALSEDQVLEAGGDNKGGHVRIRPITWRKDLVAIIRFD
jgi:cell wall-associated NlpC family hydrolase